MSDVTTDKVLAHLEVLRNDARSEMMRRMEQRDKYSIQLTVALGAIVAVSFSPTGFGKALIAAPLVALYFTVLIFYSYRVHAVLAGYLRDQVEPQFVDLLKLSPETEWESYYKSKANQVPGIRSTFFVWALWAITLLSLAYLWAVEREGSFVYVLAIVTPVYILANIWLTVISTAKRKA